MPIETSETVRGTDSNPDPITGAPGSHPVGTGVGAAAGGAAGAAIGAMAGPVGALAGAVVGAVAGGLGGKGAAEAIDPTVEDAYWRENHRITDNRGYDELAPAYRTGYTGYRDGQTFEQREAELAREYSGSVAWSDAKSSARAAYDRIAARRGAGATSPRA